MIILIIFSFIYPLKTFFDYDDWELKIVKEMTKETEINYLVKNYLRSLIYDSEKTLDEFLLQNPRIERRFFNLPLNYNKRSFLSDGSEIIEYSLRPDIFLMIAPKISERACPLCKKPFPKDLPIPSEEVNIIYTGIIIDARHLSLRRALFPKIYNEDLKEVYSALFCDSLSLIENGVVSYVKTLDAAYRHKKAGSFPLYILALKTTGKNRCDLIISNRDALALLSSLKLLEKCRVLVVYKDGSPFEK